MLIVGCHMPGSESYTCDFLQRVWAWRHLRLEGFLVVPESCVEIRHAILAKFHKPFFSNFSVVAKGLGLEAFTAGRFSCSARVLRRNSTRDPCKVS